MIFKPSILNTRLWRARFFRQNKGNRRLRCGSFLGVPSALQTMQQIGGALRMGGGAEDCALVSFKTLSRP
jgi:hypothetical protein